MAFSTRLFILTTLQILSWTIKNSYAQTLFNGNQNIYIGPNAIMSVKGSVINEGIIENNGEVLITGNWENKNDYVAMEGTLVLTGENQLVNHNGGTVYNLVIDGPGEKLFTSDINIEGRLFLENGYLTPAADVKVMAGTEAVISEGYDRSYVNGAFYHQGAGTKIFPIGKNGNYSPVVLELSSSPIIGFEVFESNPGSYFSFELREVFQTKYWQQNLVSGEVGNNSFITLPLEWYRNEDVAMEEIVIAAADNNDSYQPLATLETAGFLNSGTITAPLGGQQVFFTMGRTAEHPEDRAIYIPNAFAPDHLLARQNGEDDRIKVYGKEISENDFLFRIYNRWGVMVYETTSYSEATTKGWDGINQHTGKPESMGSFKFLLKGKFNSGRTIERSGSIHLIR